MNFNNLTEATHTLKQRVASLTAGCEVPIKWVMCTSTTYEIPSEEIAHSARVVQLGSYVGSGGDLTAAFEDLAASLADHVTRRADPRLPFGRTKMVGIVLGRGFAITLGPTSVEVRWDAGFWKDRADDGDDD